MSGGSSTGLEADARRSDPLPLPYRRFRSPCVCVGSLSFSPNPSERRSLGIRVGVACVVLFSLPRSSCRDRTVAFRRLSRCSDHGVSARGSRGLACRSFLCAGRRGFDWGCLRSSRGGHASVDHAPAVPTSSRFVWVDDVRAAASGRG